MSMDKIDELRKVIGTGILVILFVLTVLGVTFMIGTIVLQIGVLKVMGAITCTLLCAGYIAGK